MSDENLAVTTRREKIETMLRAEPNDAFLQYALAMEMEKGGETQAALELHFKLSKEHPPFVASFFRSAQILAAQNDIEQARGFLRDGIEAARNSKDLHSAAEMSEMLAQLGRHGE